MSVVRLVFLGTPDIARHCLESIFRDEHYRIVGVVTQPDRPAGRNMKLKASPVKEFAEEKKLPVITPDNVNSEEVIEVIRSWKAEAAVVVAYGQIIRHDLLNLFKRNIVNVHASLLPKWRGAAPIQRSIEAGETHTGVSLQIITQGLDAGDIIGEKKIDILPDENSLELLNRMKPLAASLLEVEFMDYLRGNLIANPQDESLVTIAPKIEKSEAEVDWSLSALKIKNKMRAFAMGPGVYGVLKGKKIKFFAADVLESTSTQMPGEIVSIEDTSFDIQTGDGLFRVLQLQPESKSKMTTKDFLSGHHLTIGDSFE